MYQNQHDGNIDFIQYSCLMKIWGTLKTAVHNTRDKYVNLGTTIILKKLRTTYFMLFRASLSPLQKLVNIGDAQLHSARNLIDKINWSSDKWVKDEPSHTILSSTQVN
jgi:hypothetical protein